MKRIRLVLADDQQAVREGLRLFLDSQPDMRVVGEAGTGAATIKAVREQAPDVVLTEIHLPDYTGVELTRRLKKSTPPVHVVAFTAVEDPVAMRAILAAQATGYVLKRSSGAELVQAIRRVCAGERYCDPVLAGQVLGKSTSDQVGCAEARSVVLSEQEASVLRLVAWGYTSKEIAARLHLSVKTVETYRARLQRKLRMKNRPALVRYALLQGWLRMT
jgi:DNA-binding NarL/FixJ family response regulator